MYVHIYVYVYMSCDMRNCRYLVGCSQDHMISIILINFALILVLDVVIVLILSLRENHK